MILIFDVFYFLLFLLGLGCYCVLEYGFLAYNEVLKTTASVKEKTIMKIMRNNIRNGIFILYTTYFISTILLYLVNKGNKISFFVLFFLSISFLMISRLRNILSNITIKIVFRHRKIKNFLLQGINFEKLE